MSLLTDMAKVPGFYEPGEYDKRKTHDSNCELLAFGICTCDFWEGKEPKSEKEFWVFWKKFDAPFSKWPSLESCKSQARSLAGTNIVWDESPNGPQGNGRHWFPRGHDDLLVVEVYTP